MYFKAWHAWALMNFRVVKIYERLCGGPNMAIEHIHALERNKYGNKYGNSGTAGPNKAGPVATPVLNSGTTTSGNNTNNNNTTNTNNNNNNNNSGVPPATRVASHLVPAIESFFHSVSVTLQQRQQRHKLVSNVLQDMLRLITLWFDYGALPQVNQAMHEGKPGDMSDFPLDVHLMST
jgi:FKBP12-rapamycin complex-associated protein